MKKEGELTQKPRFAIGIITLVLAAVLLIIALTFFILLNQQTQAGFGLSEISVAIAFAVGGTLLMLWVKSIIAKNPYLGVIIGLVLLGSSMYLFTFQYRGPFTYTFLGITGLVVLIYLGIFFFKYRTKEDHNAKEFDDNL